MEVRMKKVVCVLGSPRKGGNSTTIAEKFLETAKSLGAEAEVFSLYSLAFKGCVACMACKSKAEECVLRDDLTPVLNAIREADVVVFANPVYFGQVPGPTKCLIDRMYSFFKPTYRTEPGRSRLEPGKKLVFIATQGYPGPELFDMFRDYETFLGPEWFGFETHLIRGLGLTMPSDAAENSELLASAECLAKELLA
jgi:multimeric flavodoxin WrbA